MYYLIIYFNDLRCIIVKAVWQSFSFIFSKIIASFPALLTELPIFFSPTDTLSLDIQDLPCKQTLELSCQFHIIHPFGIAYNLQISFREETDIFTLQRFPIQEDDICTFIYVSSLSPSVVLQFSSLQFLHILIAYVLFGCYCQIYTICLYLYFTVLEVLFRIFKLCSNIPRNSHFSIFLIFILLFSF